MGKKILKIAFLYKVREICLNKIEVINFKKNMQKKQILSYLVLFGVGCIFAYLIYLQGTGLVQEENVPSAAPSAAQIAPGTQELVGNDRDEHGCIGSAGYTWCAAKNKCLRTWEEACE
jgi:hypothetical protein